MSKCPSCNLFCGLETQDPEVYDIQIDEDGRVTGQIHLARNSSCCGDEVKYYDFDIDLEPEEDVAEHTTEHSKLGEAYDLSIDENSIEYTERMDNGLTKKGKPIPLRFRRSYYGYSASFNIKCSCGKLDVDIQVEDEVQASGMDENY